MTYITDIVIDVPAVVGTLKLGNPALFAGQENGTWVPITADILTGLEEALVKKGLPAETAAAQCAAALDLVGLYDLAKGDYTPADRDCVDGSPVLTTVLVEDGGPANQQRPRIVLNNGAPALSMGRQTLPIRQEKDTFYLGSLVAEGVRETKMTGSKGSWIRCSMDFQSEEEECCFELELKTKELQEKELPRALKAGSPLGDYLLPAGGGLVGNMKALGVGYFKIASVSQQENRFSPGATKWVITLDDGRSVDARDAVVKTLDAFGTEDSVNEILSNVELFLNVAQIKPIDEKRATVKAYLVFAEDLPEGVQVGKPAATSTPAAEKEVEAKQPETPSADDTESEATEEAKPAAKPKAAGSRFAKLKAQRAA